MRLLLQLEEFLFLFQDIGSQAVAFACGSLGIGVAQVCEMGTVLAEFFLGLFVLSEKGQSLGGTEVRFRMISILVVHYKGEVGAWSVRSQLGMAHVSQTCMGL